MFPPKIQKKNKNKKPDILFETKWSKHVFRVLSGNVHLTNTFVCIFPPFFQLPVILNIFQIINGYNCDSGGEEEDDSDDDDDDGDDDDDDDDDDIDDEDNDDDDDDDGLMLMLIRSIVFVIVVKNVIVIYYLSIL